MSERTKFLKIALISALVAVVTLLHYVVIGEHLGLHILHRELYFIPIILASYWFGLKLGLATSVAVTLVYVPHVFIYDDAHGTLMAVSSHILVFNLVALVLGWLMDRRTSLKKAMGQAMDVQQNLLPKDAPKVEGLDIAGKSIYCDETGGDYYDFLEMSELGQGKISVVVGDVSDHGIPAALLMTTARAFLRQRASMSGSIANIVSDVNRQLSHDVGETGRFMTLFYAEIDTQNKSLSWVNAGHDPGIIYDSRTGFFDELAGHGLALGVFEDCEYKESQRQITPGQIIAIATDGIWEARNGRGEMFGKNRLKEIIRAHATEPAKQILDMVIKESQQFRNPLSMEDDFTLVVVKVEQ